MKTFYCVFIGLLLMGCGGDSIHTNKPIQLPFDEFWLSTRFGGSVSSNTELYFNTWAITRPHTTSDDFFHYYISDNFGGYVPSGCARTVDYLDGNLISVKVDCKLPLQGDFETNNVSWKKELSYSIQITGNTSTLKVSTAKISFKEYNQEIDFLSSSPEMVRTTINGEQELIMGGDFLVKTKDNHNLYIECHFAIIGG